MLNTIKISKIAKEKITKKLFDQLEDNNEHMANAVLLAKKFGTETEYVEGLKLMIEYFAIGYANDKMFDYQNKMIIYYNKLVS